MSLTPEIQKHLQIAFVGADERLIAERELDRRNAAIEVSRRGIAASGHAVTLFSEVFERWIEKRVTEYATIYIDTLTALNVSIDESISTEILEKLKAISSRTSPPQIPQLATLSDRAALDGHLVQAMQRAGSRAYLAAKVRVSMAELRQSHHSPRDQAKGGSVSYHVTGSNARLNINSVDRSINYTKEAADEAADALMQISKGSGSQELQNAAEEVKTATSSPSAIVDRVGKWVGLAVSSGNLMHQAIPWLEALYRYAAKL